MPYSGFLASRFEKIFLDEPLRKYLYENNITAENYLSHQESLKALFPDEESFRAFIGAYLTKTGMLSYHQFLRAPQKIDLFLHPRYIQQDLHIHDFYEIKYLLQGSGTVHIASDIIFLKQSDFCLISPYVPHSSEVYTDDAIMINIVLPSEHLSSILPRVLGFSNIFRDYSSQEQAFSGDRRFLSLSTKDNPEIRQSIQSMLDYYSAPSGRSMPGYLMTEAALEQVFLRILSLQTMEKEKGENLREVHPSLDFVTGYIRDHLQNVSLADVAALLHFSEPYTSRYLKKKTGYTFQMLLLILRMEQTAKLLKETDWSVDQIAAEVGMSGRTNFYKQFRSFYGMSPAEFRAHIPDSKPV